MPSKFIDMGHEVHSHIPQITIEEPPFNDSELSVKNFFYNLVIVFCYLVNHIFFRELEIAGIHNVPKEGPVILVCAPHSNQFVDAAVVYTPIKQILGRNISGIIAENSTKKFFIGLLSKLIDSVPVPRAQDNLKLVKEGKIYIKESDIGNDDTVVTISGLGTKFTKFEESGILGLPQRLGEYKIKEIINDEQLILAKPIKNSKAIDLLLGKKGLEFKYCGKVDTNKTFQNVFNHLHRQGMIAIFPEGGSHDRTELLPLKPGVGIMALGSIAAITQSVKPDAKIAIVPTGLYYFHPNKFRSRAVLEFGEPLYVSKADGEKYIETPRKAVDELLGEIKEGLQSVTITAPDRETLRNIQAIRRLYKSNTTKPMTLSTVNESIRRLLIGWNHYKDREEIQSLFKSVQDYNNLIYQLGLKDHQIKNRNLNSNRLLTLKVLINRLTKLIVFGTLSLPGTILFFPVFIVVSVYSKKKQEEALKKSTVKIRATDVVASWKIIVATVAGPIFYIFYSIIGVKLIRSYDSLFGIRNPLILFILCYLILVFTTYCAYRIGEAGMDILKSLPPLFVQLVSHNSLTKLQQQREELSNKVTDICNNLGPALFDDFDSFYAHGKVDQYEEHSRKDSSSNRLLTAPSFSSLSNIQFFSHDDHVSPSETEENVDNDDISSMGSSFEHIEISKSTGVELHPTNI